MPEFHYYGSDLDQRLIFKTLFEKTDFGIVADSPHDTPVPPVFDSVTPESLEAIGRHPQCFIVGRFSTAGINCFQCDYGPAKGKFIIDRAISGPYMLLDLPMCKKLDGVHWHLGPASLYLPGRGKLGYHERADWAALSRAFRTIVDTVQSHSRKDAPFVTSWIGSDARRLLTAGEAFILDVGKWYDGVGDFVRRNMPASRIPITGPRKGRPDLM